jgi:hypothetical protein
MKASPKSSSCKIGNATVPIYHTPTRKQDAWTDCHNNG